MDYVGCSTWRHEWFQIEYKEVNDAIVTANIVMYVQDSSCS